MKPATTRPRSGSLAGTWIEQKPRDVFFFEQEGAFVVRLLMSGQAGSRHELAEFTRDDIEQMVASGPSMRQPVKMPGTGPAPSSTSA